MALEPKDRERLEKLLNMLGSPNEGEIGNAGRMIQKMATRYNVTPAVLCLGNPTPPRQPQEEDLDSFRRRHRTSYGNPFEDPTQGFGYRTSGFRTGRSWAEQEAERMAREQREKAEADQRKRNEDYHARREEELRKAGEEAVKKSKRRPRNFSGTYFGLLSQLKTIYDDQFATLETYILDYIELLLDTCTADRMMTRQQMNIAKAIIKEHQEPEPLV